MTSYKLPVIAVSISFVFWFGLYFGLYFADWPGDPHPCSNPPYCFCETVYVGTLAAQKSNTWSDLGFVLAAFFMAWHGSKLLSKKTNITTKPFDKPSYSNSPLLISIYVSAILYMGPGSMFFHGSMKQWGGWLDVISMYVFVNFVIAYLLYRTWSLCLKSFIYLYLLLCGVAIALSVFLHDLSSQVFPLFAAVLISLALIQSIPIKTIGFGRTQNIQFDKRWLIAAISFFVCAVIIWRLSDTGKALCYPDSLLQGHAAWHLLSACMTICIHFFFLSEKDLSEKNDRQSSK
jgi:hypothetical protein